MNIQKTYIANAVRKRYPETFGIRKRMQTLKIRKLNSHFMSSEDTLMCERFPKKKDRIIKPYLRKWNRYLVYAYQEIDDIFKNADLYRNRSDKDEVITDMLFCRLAYGFIPSEYVSYDLVSKSPEQRQQYASDIDTSVFGYSVNNIKTMQSILDKGMSYKKYAHLFLRDALVIDRNTDYGQFCEFIQAHPVFVEKVVLSSKGMGVRRVEACSINKKEYFKGLVSSGRYILEECVVQADSMSRFNPTSVNTVRCIVFKTKEGPVIPYTFMKTGRNGSFIDNGAAGGLLVGIDVESGMIFSNGIDEYGNEYEKHPDTGVVFKHTYIPQWNEMKSLCLEVSERIDGMNYLSWDMSLTDRGWAVIEINILGQLIGPQTVMKRGIKAELSEYFDKMPKEV